MQFTRKFRLLILLFREIGIRQLAQYVIYRIATRSGYLYIKIRIKSIFRRDKKYALKKVLDLPPREVLKDVIGDQINLLLSYADEIVDGKIRLFDAQPVTLTFISELPLKHWTRYSDVDLDNLDRDIKYIWEPARFGWVYYLIRAYVLVGDEKYPLVFWEYFEEFFRNNPNHQGLHWISAQEVALRLIALVYANQAFTNSEHSNEYRKNLLASFIVTHAERIPLTFSYSRAQNSNHLISEAVGLLTASMALPDHPSSGRWKGKALKWLNQGLRDQIDDHGNYIQHSTNYHRLMLQLVAWVKTLEDHANLQPNSQPRTNRKPYFDEDVRHKINSSITWLVCLLDRETGKVPNLGHNDGSYIFPLTNCEFNDYRPVLQTLARAFLGTNVCEQGQWDEMAMWFNQADPGIKKLEYLQPVAEKEVKNPLVIQNRGSNSWAYFRVSQFNNRPAHADQLHLDLWWHGLNIAMDAGTYLYNAKPPWENNLAQSAVHNTVTIDGQGQMLRVGRFLYLDWAQAEFIGRDNQFEGKRYKISARHNGYRKLGVIHHRSVETNVDGGWTITDQIIDADLTQDVSVKKVRLHWLLPDFPWQLEQINSSEVKLILNTPQGDVYIHVAKGIGSEKIEKLIGKSNDINQEPITACIVRAGVGKSRNAVVQPEWGWVSANYGKREPAISFAIETSARPPLLLVTKWAFSR